MTLDELNKPVTLDEVMETTKAVENLIWRMYGELDKLRSEKSDIQTMTIAEHPLEQSQERFSKTHLVYDHALAIDGGEGRYPAVVMSNMGIRFQTFTKANYGITSEYPIFWNCENVPKELPPYITKTSVNPMSLLGTGLTRKQAEEIQNYRKPEEQTDLTTLLNALNTIGIKYTVRERREYKYLFIGDRTFMHGRGDFSTADLDDLLRQHKYVEFENGELASYFNS